jgi:hypothetical protein
MGVASGDKRLEEPSNRETTINAYVLETSIAEALAKLTVLGASSEPKKATLVLRLIFLCWGISFGSSLEQLYLWYLAFPAITGID